MPTGYTRVLQERPDISFQEFVLRCARAMGACVMQRDDNMDEPPKMEEPFDYHKKSLKVSKEQLQKWQSATDKEVRQYYIDKLNTEREYIQEYVKDRVSLVLKSYDRMLRLVQKWEPPTNEHVNFKNFMIEQIKDSIRWDCDTSYYDDEIKTLSSLLEKSTNELRALRLDELEHDIEYHSKHWKEEVESVNARNKWKQELFDSLGYTVGV